MKELDNLKKEVENCRKCELWKTATNSVFGEGNEDSDIMFIGEAPGYWEDKKAKPFVGKAGKLLDELFEYSGLKREEIYITNILKHRPPNNRNPEKKEIEACTPYLDKQIELIKPKIICTLGNFATKYILEKFGLIQEIDGISKIHGRVFKISNLFGTLKIIPLYHPAVAVYNPNMKDILRKDFKVVKQILDLK